MLQSKAFVKKTRKGKVFKVVREHYLRDDIWSGSPLDAECDQDAVKLSASPAHYLTVDTNIVLQQVMLVSFMCATLCTEQPKGCPTVKLALQYSTHLQHHLQERSAPWLQLIHVPSIHQTQPAVDTKTVGLPSQHLLSSMSPSQVFGVKVSLHMIQTTHCRWTFWSIKKASGAQGLHL